MGKERVIEVLELVKEGIKVKVSYTHIYEFYVIWNGYETRFK